MGLLELLFLFAEVIFEFALEAAFDLIFRAIAEVFKAPNSTIPYLPAWATLKQVLSFIEDQLAEDLSLEQTAAVAGISASHLNALFRISMGTPVHQYVTQRHVDRAKTLLMHNGLSMAEIALAAGFAHQSYMARHMRRVLGLTPRALKRLLVQPSSSH